MTTQILELEDHELEDRLLTLEAEIAKKRASLQLLTSSIADAHTVIQQYQHERTQFGDKLLVSEEVSPLVEEVKVAKELLSLRQLHLLQLKEGKAAEQQALDDLQRKLEILLAMKAQSDDRKLGAMNDEVLGLKLATQAEEAMCSTIKEQLAKCPSVQQVQKNHREMFDRMLDDVVNQCSRKVDMNISKDTSH